MDLCDYNEMRALLADAGFRFSKSKGQNFLTARWVPERIAGEADLGPGDGVVEPPGRERCWPTRWTRR